MVYRASQALVRVIARVLYGLRAEGAGNIPRDGGVIVAATHESFLDPPLVGALIPRLSAFVARSTLFESKGRRSRVREWIGRIYGMLAVDRSGGAAREGLRRMRAALDEGLPLVIFPEGTRSTDGGVARFRKGVGVLALASGHPVLPVSVEGTARAWPKGRRLPRLFGGGPIYIRFGEPVTYSRPLRPEDVAADIRDRILDLRGERQTEPARDGAGAHEIAGGGSST